ncbi:hypothetical protein CNMCM5878_005672 [Aspergillus fumigatiaffinis]|jgi:transposase|nr:hypothetical protein CNMCM5878_005672 [Aspergillus fumigatiaffinis]
MQRTPLKEINTNRGRGNELSLYTRGIIRGLREKGSKLQEISDALEIPLTTVQYTLEKEPQRQEGKSRARPGQPNKLSNRDERSILRAIRTDPFISYKDIREKTGVSVSDTTIRRCLKKSGYGHWRAKKRPQLTKEAAKLRLEWAKARENWGVEEFQRIIWSDECSIQLGKGKGQQWVWRLDQLGSKWKKENIAPYVKPKKVSIMIWAAIWGGGHSEINQMTRDENSQRNGYSAASYLEILEENLFAIYSPEMSFMQDNAPIHTARIIKKWFEDNGISTIDWPPYSPDLNPIEHAWAKLKEMIYQLDPDIENYQGSIGDLKDRFNDLIERAWEGLGQEYFDKLIESMPRRIQAVIEAKGWYTKY